MHSHTLAAALGGALLLGSLGAAAAPDAAALRLELDRSNALVAAQVARAAYPEYFRRAYARYPNLPAGALEAIAYSETNWVHVRPEAQNPRDLHMPRSYGVMGLYHGGGFADMVGDGARLIGRSAQQVIDDPESNILAAAALLDRALAAGQPDKRSRALAQPEAMAAVLARYAGYGASNGGIADYARQSFAYGVMQTLQQGVDAQGVKIPAQPLELERAFDAGQLQKLRAPALLMNAADDSVRANPALSRELARSAAPATDVGAKAVDFGEAIWNPASSSNYSTASNQTSAVIMHTMEGSYAGSISWFQNPSAQVSAHYLIRKSDGQITQMVREYHQAWHAKNHNYYTIGIEHDGRAADAGNWSAAMVNASARLTKSICARRGVNCASAWKGPGYDTFHLVPDSVRVKGHGMLSGNENRYDPGKYFPWSNYYNLINGGGGNPNPPGKYWVDTFANATGYKWPSTLTPVGTLNQGTNYVYCKAWGEEVRVGNSYNHYWLKTDLDVGPAGAWVSAYYLSRWGNDEARDNSGAVIPDC
ncbi:N-acetylmuramoyl-L-alanine amidase [Lysobacter enzymogenes]|uniref:N-acetylmuramoyl-L-alanine amidase n=1 Tax=Lysobacter enzymogenes TaxID=69 RepID=UPI00089D1453|nr:peptidoglycan recognition family protein [Lysobacter enzymogenes]SDW07703.1 N-acetylmuramoyl-L-alanine amidase [Lysobacter enzymogenes]